LICDFLSLLAGFFNHKSTIKTDQFASDRIGFNRLISQGRAGNETLESSV